VTAREPLIAARGVARRFGPRVALAPTDFDLRPGEAVALVGPNGAGKSTLLALLAGSLAPTEGTVERRAGVRVGWAPQQPACYGRLSARENMELFAALEGEPDPPAAAGRLLRAFELPDSDDPSSELSAGNRQRLNLGLALLGDPNVLLLDEPTASLDPRQRGRFWQAVLPRRENGGAIVFATQSLDEPVRLADRVVALRDGAIVFDGAPSEFELEDTVGVEA
jgi:ABC-2 type transport system ATP-binding protein